MDIKKRRSHWEINGEGGKRVQGDALTVRQGSFKAEFMVLLYQMLWGFPGGSVAKNPPANAGDTGSNPDPGRSHMPWNS